MLISEKIEQLISFFGSLGERFDLFYTVDKGTFVTGSIKLVFMALSELISTEKLIFPGDSFIDMGSGDGRVCVIASILGLQTYGIEYNETIVDSSQENIKNLITQGILSSDTENIPTIVQGDFLDDTTYERLGVPFETFHIFFNFVTYHEDLAKKIVDKSPAGTLFILHSPCPINFKYEGLELLKEISLTSIYQVMYVYRKN